jgi:DNA-binding protein HU-beta
MKYPELVAQVAKQRSMKARDVRVTLDAALAIIADALAKDEPVNLPGVGRMVVRNRPEKQVTDAKTGAKETVPAQRRILVKQP